MVGQPRSSFRPSGAAAIEAMVAAIEVGNQGPAEFIVNRQFLPFRSEVGRTCWP